EMPCIAIEHLQDASTLSSAIDELAGTDWLVVTSPAGADAIARVGRPRAGIAAIGPTTAARLAANGIEVRFVPSRSSGAVLAHELPRADRVVLARSDHALPDAPGLLRDRGFDVTEVIAYRTVVGARGDVDAARAALGDPRERVAVYVASPSAVDGLLDAVSAVLVRDATVFASGMTTLAHARARLGDGAHLQLMEEVVSYVTHG